MKYNSRNEEVIQYLHPAMQHKAWQGLESLELIGEDVLLASGLRTLLQQAEEWAKGRTKPGRVVTNAEPGWSFHNFGLAIDIVPVGPLGIPLEKRTHLEWAAMGRYETLGRELQHIGLQWGWQLWGFDKPHFQYVTTSEGTHLTIEQVRAGLRPDVERARQERREALIHHIDIAEKAVNKSWMKEKRRQHLLFFIETKRKRLETI